MTTYYTNNPSRFGGCYATHDPTVAQSQFPVITSQPQDATIGLGGSNLLSVTATGVILTYQWYTGVAGDTSSPIVGETGSSTTVSPIVNTSYWVRVTSNGVYSTNSATATITVSGAAVTTAVVPRNTAGGGYKFTPFNPGRLRAETAMQAALKAAMEKTGSPDELVVKKAEEPEVSFTPAVTTEDRTPELLRKIEEYESIANEVEQATRKRMGLLEMQRQEEEEMLIMLLAQLP